MTPTSQPDPKAVTIYTDGAAEPNPGPGGYGVVLIYGSTRKELSGGFELTTNNRMELTAAIVALETLKQPCAVTLYSDSTYVVESVTSRSVFKWRGNDWVRRKGQRAKNHDLWERFLVAYEQHDVTMQWVRGHVGVEENERCDILAGEAAKQAGLPVDEGYIASLNGDGHGPLWG